MGGQEGARWQCGGAHDQAKLIKGLVDGGDDHVLRDARESLGKVVTVAGVAASAADSDAGSAEAQRVERRPHLHKHVYDRLVEEVNEGRFQLPRQGRGHVDNKGLEVADRVDGQLKHDEQRGRSLEVMGGRGRSWEVVGGHGGSWDDDLQDDEQREADPEKLRRTHGTELSAPEPRMRGAAKLHVGARVANGEASPASYPAVGVPDHTGDEVALNDGEGEDDKKHGDRDQRHPMPPPLDGGEGVEGK